MTTEERLARLEKQNRQLRMVLGVLVLILAAGFMVARLAAGRADEVLRKATHMMRSHHRHFGAFVGLILLLVPGISRAADVETRPLLLAKDGQTRYAIVIAVDAREAEVYAAEELATFLAKMTGAVFHIRRDDVFRTTHEIVIGHTNRRKLEDLPASLRTDNFEGFSLVRDGEHLLIIGNIPRGTLYGVYDFLDVELGVRFLAHRINHVPSRPTLELAFTSRVYGPPLEKRTIWQANPMGDAILRNRMNGIGFQVLNEKMLGGVKMIGRPTHTYLVFVPQDKYFAEHPEYFALIDGERRHTYKGLISQLCLTNPDVIRLSKEVVRGWLQDASRTNRYNKYIVSVSANDSQNFCECAACEAVNREEGVSAEDVPSGSYGGGTHVRFVNAIADMVAQNFPHASVQTMFYHMQLPKKTRLASNVILMNGSSVNWYYPMDDMSKPSSHRMKRWLTEWKNAAGDGHQYIWTKHINFGNYLKPRANLRWIARNIAVMAKEYGLKGQFAQNGQTAGAEFQTIRYYLLARAMWRPQDESQDEIEEFCRLYYGDAGDDALQYINYVHDEYLEYIDGVAEEDQAFWHADRTREDKGRCIRTADGILSHAESKVEAPDMKLRVATLRLPVWKTMLDLYEDGLKKDPDLVPPEQIRIAGQRFIDVGRAVRLTHMSETYDGPNARTERGYYLKIRKLLRNGLPEDPRDPWIIDDEDLERADLTRARRLNLCGTKVTDAGLVHLSRLPQLRELDLRYTHVTDEGLRHLEDLVTLTELHLGGNAHHVGTKITDRGIQNFSGLQNLIKLSLSHTKISNASVQIIKGMKFLTHLDLGHTPVNDDGLADLAAALPDLEYLVLSTWTVGDAGLSHLHRLKHLLYLDLWDATSVTENGIETLSRALPHLHIREY